MSIMNETQNVKQQFSNGYSSVRKTKNSRYCNICVIKI